MADKTVTVRLKAEIAAYQAALKKAAVSTAEFTREIGGLGTSGSRNLERVGKAALIATTGIAAGLGLSMKAAVNWESAWAGVTKTVDGTHEQMAQLEDDLRGLANELPATHAEIAGVAEAAGQLGIKREAIEGFTRTMVDLSETTNLTADQAAADMARLANIMRTPQAEIERLGSTLVALGNDGASTEADILSMGMRIAGAGKQVGLSEDQVLSFANALSSVGVEAEAGGTAISRVFSTIASAVADGGEELDRFARVAGMSSDEFSRAFREDAAGATVAFIEGLEGITASGGNVFAVLQELELGDIRVRDALLRAAGAGDLFSESLDLGARAWEENNALQLEAAKRYETTASELGVLRNNVVDLGIDVGDRLIPALSGTIDLTGTMVRGFGELDGAAGLLVTGLSAVSVAGFGIIGAFGTIGPKVRAFQDSLRTMGTLGTGLANNLGRATAALAAVGIAVGVYSYVLGRNAQRKQEAIDLSKEYAEAIRAETGALNDNIDAVSARKLGEFGGTTRLRELGADFDILLEGIRETGDALGLLSSQFNVGQLSGEFARELEEAGLAGTEFGDELLRIYELMGGRGSNEFDDFLGKLRELGTGYSDGAILAANLDSATEGVGGSAANAAPKVDRLATSMGLSAEEAKAAEEAVRDLMDAYRASVDPLFGMLDALDRNREAQGAQAAAVAEGGERVAEATDSVREAERGLNEARASGDADSIATAEERLADARANLAETSADAALSEEELAAMNRDAARSALEVESAAQNLALAIQNGTVSLDTAKAMLAEWVAQGLITEEQAAAVATQFDVATLKAQAFSGDYIANAYANTEQAEAAFDRLYAKVQRLIDTGQGLSVDVAQAEKFLVPRAMGGDLVPGVPYLFGEHGPEIGVFGERGVMYPTGVMPPGSWSAAAGGNVSTSMDNSRHVSIAPTYQMQTTDPRELAADASFELHVLLAELRT